MYLSFDAPALNNMNSATSHSAAFACTSDNTSTITTSDPTNTSVHHPSQSREKENSSDCKLSASEDVTLVTTTHNTCNPLLLDLPVQDTDVICGRGKFGYKHRTYYCFVYEFV
jgi:hypothetical protein